MLFIFCMDPCQKQFENSRRIFLGRVLDLRFSACSCDSLVNFVIRLWRVIIPIVRIRHNAIPDFPIVKGLKDTE